MRTIFFVLLLIGAGVAFVYPWAIRSVEGREIGQFRVYDMATGFRPVDVSLDAAGSPVRLIADVTAVIPATLPAGASVLTLTVSAQGRTVLAKALDLADAEIRDDSPQTLQRIYRLDAGPFDIAAGGPYTVTAGPGEADGVEVMTVDVILRAGLGLDDDRAQPIGLSIMAIGFIGLVIAIRRASAPAAKTGSAPPKPRWGRGAGER